MPSLYKTLAWFSLFCGAAVNAGCFYVAIIRVLAGRGTPYSRHTIGAWLASLCSFVPVGQLMLSAIRSEGMSDDDLPAVKKVMAAAVVTSLLSHGDAWMLVRKLRMRSSTRSYLMWVYSSVFATYSILLYSYARPLSVLDPLVSGLMAIWCLIVALYGPVYYILWFLFSKKLKGRKLELLPDDSLFGLELFLKLDYTRPPLTSVAVVAGYMIVSLSLLLFLPVFLKACFCGSAWFGTSLEPAWRGIMLTNMAGVLWAGHVGPFVQTMWKKRIMSLQGAIVVLFVMLPVNGWLYLASLYHNGGPVLENLQSAEFTFSCA